MSSILDVAEGLGSSQFRRFFLPGIIAAVGLHAYIPSYLSEYLKTQHAVTQPILLGVEVLLFGLLLSSAAVPIFYLYEGFLLSWLTVPARLWNERRVKKQQEKLEIIYQERDASALSPREIEGASSIEAFLSDFPTVPGDNETYVYKVERPTRLGNIIASYELYPETRYAIDGIFFWSHFLCLAPEVSRDDYKEKSAFAESLLLSSAAGALVAVAASTTLIAFALGSWLPDNMALNSPLELSTAWGLLAFGLTAFGVFYRLSWSAHRSAGRSFRGLVDLAMPAFREWLGKVETPPSPKFISEVGRVYTYLEVLSTSE
jgi:hypothetical protein